MTRRTAKEFDPELLDLYDYYVHGQIDRRGFIDRAAKFAVGGLTAGALLEMLSPQYAFAAQVPKEDPRVSSNYLKYPSPAGSGEMRGLFAKPVAATGRLRGIVVVHENRGLMKTWPAASRWLASWLSRRMRSILWADIRATMMKAVRFNRNLMERK